MAIGTTPIFSKISGSVGPVDYRTRRNGKIEIGKKRIPANPQSTEQQNTRNAYGQLHELWQNAAWIDKTQYENIATKYEISPWNAFIMRHLSTLRLNPAAYWPFVEGTGNTLHDISTNQNHGTITGAAWTISDNFQIPQLYFDELDDYVTIPHSNSLNIDDNITIETWMSHLTGALNYRVFITKGVNNYLLYLVKTGGVWYPRIYTTCASGASYATSSTPIDFNKKYQIIGSYDSIDGAKIFINTIETGTDTPEGLINKTVTNATIGRWAGNTGFMKGNIIETCIYNTLLSQTQKQHLYNSKKAFYEV